MSNNRSMYSNSSEQYWKKRKKETNPFHSRIVVVIVTLCITTFLVRTTFTSRSRAENERQQRREEYERMRVMRRTSSASTSTSSSGLEIGPTTSVIIATEEQLSLCESNMRDALRLECDDMCNVELSSLPRPTMYRSCHHGCSRSFYSAAVEGCREGGGVGVASVSVRGEQATLSVPSPGLPPSSSASSSSQGNEGGGSWNRVEANSSCSRFMMIEPKPDVQSTCKKYYRDGTKRGRIMGLTFINDLLDAEWERQRVNFLAEMKKLI